MKKGLLRTICALVATCWWINASADVYEYDCGATENDNVTVTIDTESGVMTVSGTGAMKGYNYNTLPWLDYVSYVTTGKVEEGITNVGAYAFYKCTAMESVTLPSTVTSINKAAFSGCSTLAAIEFPEKLTKIGSYAFSNCTSITTLTLPESITSLDTYSFYTLTGLKTVVIKSKITALPQGVFCDCYALTSITLPEGLETIGYLAFSRCKKLTSITLPSTLTTLSKSAFDESGLTEIVIPKSVTSIQECTGAGTYTSFRKCQSLKSIIVEEGNPVYDSRDNCNAIIKTATNTLIIGCYNSTIPNTVTTIGKESFYGLTSLKSISIPTTINTIDYSAFAYCDNVTSIDIPKSVTSVDEYAFGRSSCTNYSCKTDMRRPVYFSEISKGCFNNAGFESVILGSQVQSIGSLAFSYNNFMTSKISLAETTPSIESNSFNNLKTKCTLYYPKGSDYSAWSSYFKGMVEIDLSGECGDGLTWEFDAETYTLKISGSGAMTDYTTDSPAPWSIYAKAIETVILSNEQTSVDDLAFDGCINLTAVIYEGENKLAVETDAFADVDDSAVLYVKAGKKDEYSDMTDFAEVKEITLTLDTTESTIGYEETVTLTPTYSLADVLGDVEYTWTSSESTVATVADGVVTPNNPGETDVKVQVTTPAGNTLEAVCHVNVIDAATGIEDVKTDSAEDGVIYDLMGRKVMNPAQGIYIKNGKKFIVK